MKALSILQPWAALIALGLKQYETRSWQPAASFWGQQFIIHAGKDSKELSAVFNRLYRLHQAEQRPEFNSFDWHFLNAMKEVYGSDGSIKREQFAFGAAIAVATLERVTPTEQLRNTISPREKAFGGYGDKRFGWKFTNVRMFNAIPCSGQLGVFELRITTPEEILF